MQTTTSGKSQGLINCDGCDHPIHEDQRILSDIPEQIPEDFPREAFRHFHIHCHRCGANSIPCYQMYASRQIPFAAQANADCDRCGHTIHAGQDVLRDSFLASKITGDSREKRGVSGWFAGIGRAHKSVDHTPFKALPLNLKLKFVKAGLGNGRGYRTLAEAEHLYLRTVPRSVRNSGWKGVADYVKGKHASHIESVMNAPSKAKMSPNTLWEPSKWNIKRGSANMKPWDKMRAHTMNRADTARIVGKNALINARRATILAALMEAPVSAAEGAIRVAKGKMSKKDAAKKAAIHTTKSGAVGLAMAGGFTFVAALGAGPILSAASPVLIPMGVVAYSVSSAQRIKAAMHDPNPLPRVPFYFHTDCSDCGTGLNCFEKFAAEMSRPA